MRALALPVSPLPWAIFMGFLLFSPESFSSEGHPNASYPPCTQEPPPRELTAARGAFEAGQAAFHEADYERAILYWEDAFRRDCTAAPLLLNLAHAYELSNQKEQAVRALETYLQRRPSAADRPALEKRINTLKKQTETEAPAPAPREPAPTTSASVENVPPPQPSPTETSRPIWPIVLTGGGVAALAVGIPFFIAGQNKVDHSKENCPLFEGQHRCPAGSDYEAEGNRGIEQRNLGIGLTLGGGALSLSGALLWAFLWKDSGEPKETTFTPLVSPGFAGFSLDRKF